MDAKTILLLVAAAVLAGCAGVGLSFAAARYLGLDGVIARIVELAVALVLFVVLARLFGVT